MTTRGSALALAVALLAGGCGESPTGDLAEIRSGTLTLRVVAAATGDGSSGRPVGFAMTGPFSMRSNGRLPLARLEYERILGERSEATTFTSTGDRAFLTVDGTAYELGREEVDALARDQGGGEGRGALEELEVDDWIEGAERSTGEPVDGVETRRVTGTVDVAAALHDLALLARHLGTPGADQLRPPTGEDAERLQRAVRSSSIEVLSGRRDRLLRRLRLTVDFGATVSERVKAALGPYAGSRLDVDLSLSRPNQDITVEAPSNPRPITALRRTR